MRHKYLLVTLLLISAVVISGCIGKRYDKTEKIEYKINPTGKTKLVIDNVKGKISVTKGDSASGIQITAEISAKVKKKDLDKPIQDVIELRIDTTTDVVRVEQEENSGGFHFLLGQSTPKVNYTIKVPENLKLEIDNVNGDVDLRDLTGNANISVISGNITGERLYGETRLEVVNGHITVTLDSTKGLNIDAVNGNINLFVTELFKGQIKATTVNGKVKIDDKLKFEHGHSEKDTIKSEDKHKFEIIYSDKNSFKGIIGNSETDVKIEVVNGKVNINKK